MLHYRAIFTQLVWIKQDRLLAVQPNLAVQHALRLQTRVKAVVIPAVHTLQSLRAKANFELKYGINNHKMRTEWLSHSRI